MSGSEGTYTPSCRYVCTQGLWNMNLVRKIPYILPIASQLSTLSVEVDITTSGNDENYIELGGQIDLRRGLEKYVIVEQAGHILKEYILIATDYGAFGAVPFYGIGANVYDLSNQNTMIKYPTIFLPGTREYIKNDPLNAKEFYNNWDVEFLSRFYLRDIMEQIEASSLTVPSIYELEALYTSLGLYNMESIPGMWFNYEQFKFELYSMMENPIISFPRHVSDHPTVSDRLVSEFATYLPFNVVNDPFTTMMLNQPRLPPTAVMGYLRYHTWDIDDTSIRAESDMLKLIESSDEVLYVGAYSGVAPEVSVSTYSLYESLAVCPFYEFKLKYTQGVTTFPDRVTLMLNRPESCVYLPQLGVLSGNDIPDNNGWLTAFNSELDAIAELFYEDVSDVTVIMQDYHAFVIFKVEEYTCTLVYDMIALRLVSRTLLLTPCDPSFEPFTNHI